MGSPQGFDRREVLYRIGTFFLMLGIGLLAFFILSEAARNVIFDYLCASLICLVLGFVFRNQAKPPVKPSGRFSFIKRFIPKSKQEQGKK